MALPFEIQIGRVVRFLSKWASTKGSSPRVSLGSEIVPTLPMWSGVENRFLDSWDKFGVYTSVAALAANNSGVRFRNPPGSNVVAVVELIRVEVDTTASAVFDEINPGPVNTDLGAIVPARGLDSRGRQQATCIYSAGNTIVTLGANSGIGFVFPPVGVHADFILDDDQEITVLPGAAMQIFTNAVNVLLRCALQWRERSLEESERT